MRLQSINVATPKRIEGANRKSTTAIYKQPVRERVMLRRLGLAGDGQADLRNHGGSFRAAYAYDAAHYGYWSQELGRNDMAPGQFGENFTVTGMDENDIHVGDVFRIGEALVQVTQPRVPCHKLTAKMGVADFQARFLRSNRSGFYLRVLEEGMVAAGDEFIPVHRDPDSLSVARVNALRFHDKDDLDGIARAWALAALSHDWKEAFQAMLNKAARRGS
jgi:MOSC domain-containing protein YiiM